MRFLKMLSILILTLSLVGCAKSSYTPPPQSQNAQLQNPTYVVVKNESSTLQIEEEEQKPKSSNFSISDVLLGIFYVGVYVAYFYSLFTD